MCVCVFASARFLSKWTRALSVAESDLALPSITFLHMLRDRWLAYIGVRGISEASSPPPSESQPFGVFVGATFVRFSCPLTICGRREQIFTPTVTSSISKGASFVGVVSQSVSKTGLASVLISFPSFFEPLKTPEHPLFKKKKLELTQ